MKSALMAFALASLFAAAPRFAQNPPAGPRDDSIEVNVIGTDGGPLDDVDVTLSGARDASATTGRDGRVIFRNLIRGDYQIRAGRPGFMSVGSDGHGVMQAELGKDPQELEFSTQGIPESRYRLTNVGGLPLDGYVADIRLNGRTVYDEGMIDVGRDPLDLELDIRGNGGVIEGTVTLPFQAEIASPIAVALIPDKPRRDCVFLYKRTDVFSGLDAPITFTFNGVAPGSYRILALDHLLRGDEMNADLIAQYEGRGVAVTVAAGSRLGSIQAPLIEQG